MRNLRLLHRLSQKFNGIAPKFMTLHLFRENIAFVYDRNSSVKIIDRDSGDIKDLCRYEDIVAMEFIQLSDCLCISTEKGEIIQFNLSNDESEVVGLINDGIEAMSWSPDQELVVFITK